MKFKESPYYNEKFLGIKIYENISNNSEIFTVQEYFGLNNKENKYIKKRKNNITQSFHYELIVYSDHYELSCYDYNIYLYLIFDKPVHITGKYCRNIFAPEIVIKNSENKNLSYCVTNKAIVDNSCKNYYEINNSKIDSLYFHNDEVRFYYSEVSNFFIFNKKLIFNGNSYFLGHHKNKCFGSCRDLKSKISEYKHFKQGIIHIE